MAVFMVIPKPREPGEKLVGVVRRTILVVQRKAIKIAEMAGGRWQVQGPSRRSGRRGVNQAVQRSEWYGPRDAVEGVRWCGLFYMVVLRPRDGVRGSSR